MLRKKNAHLLLLSLLNPRPHSVCSPLSSRKNVASSPADVVVTGGESSLHIKTPKGELSLTLPAGVTFEQGSCTPTPAGDFCEEELHFRLRICVTRSPDEGNVQDNCGETHPDHVPTPAPSRFARPVSAKARTKSFWELFRARFLS